VFMVFRALGWSRLPEFAEEKEAGYWARKQSRCE
jgi:hypothetical protein